VGAILPGTAPLRNQPVGRHAVLLVTPVVTT